MTPRERFQAVMWFQKPDRLPVVEWAVWWDKTLERWRGEGLPSHLSDRYEVASYFGLDPWFQDWLSPRKPECPLPASEGQGIIADEDDYERILPHLYPADAVDSAQWSSWAVRQAAGEAVLWFTVEGFFWFPRTLLGIEGHMYAMYDQPDLIHRINRDLTDWMLSAIRQIAVHAKPDFMTFAEDLSYNHGPMLSREHFEEYCLPYYRQVIPVLEQMGTLPFIDSDGDITACLPWFRPAGLRGALPLERQAGVDIMQLRQIDPDFLFIGHFDKMTMCRGREAMRREFERLLPAARQGGFIVSVDHQTPPGVSLDQYRDYLGLLNEFCQLAAID